MGLTYADLVLANAEDLTLERAGALRGQPRWKDVRALVDSGAVTLIIDDDTADALGLRRTGSAHVRIADGNRREVAVVGPVEVRFAGRRCITDALVVPGGRGIMLGAVPMEMMDLVVIPSQNRLAVNPESPDLPTLLAVGVRLDPIHPPLSGSESG